jgi:putative ABC transport system ATP-binding protein
MVTHDSRYTHFAKRTINLFDGEVVTNVDSTKSLKGKLESKKAAGIILNPMPVGA